MLTHFDKYPLHGLKLYNYLIWRQIVIEIKNKNFSSKGMVYIKSLSVKLNKWN